MRVLDFTIYICCFNTFFVLDCVWRESDEGKSEGVG